MVHVTNCQASEHSLRVYVFERREDDDWRLDAALGPPPGVAAGFGAAVGVLDSVIGSTHAGSPGLVQLFGNWGGFWVPLDTLAAPEDTWTQYGVGLILDDDLIITGAPTGGAVHVYERP